jgi:hypothetical protein
MSRLLGPAPFPFGVADAAGRFAFIRLADSVFLVSLADGGVVWQAREAWQPLLLGDDLAIAWQQQGPTRAALVSLERAADGSLQERWRTEVTATVPPRPGAVPTMEDVCAAWCDDDVAVKWVVRDRYTGGASPPSAARAAPIEQCYRFERSTGQSTPLAGWPQEDAVQAKASAALPAPAHGERSYEVNAASRPDASPGFRLVARSAADGTVVWERTFDGPAVRRVPRPRP